MTTLMKMVLPYGKAKVVKQHLKSLKFSFALTHEEASLIARIQQNYEAMYSGLWRNVLATKMM